MISYVDPDTGRVYTNMIDLSKVTTEHLESNMNNLDNAVAVNIEILNHETGETICHDDFPFGPGIQCAGLPAVCD